MNVQELLAREATSAGPPADVPPSRLLAMLMATERPSEVRPFVRNGADGKPLFEYRMQILTQQELDTVRAKAENYTRECLRQTNKLTDEQVSAVRREAWSEIYEDAKCFELLRIAMREVTIVEAQAGGLSSETFRKYPPLFTSTRQMRDLLTTDEAASLFHEYEAIQFRYGPMWRLLTDDESEAWIERIVEGAGSFPFLALLPGERARLTVSLAFALRRLKIAIGSLGLDFSAMLRGTSQSELEASDATADPNANPTVHAPPEPKVEG